MTDLRCYVITAFDRASFVRSVVHPDLVDVGAVPVSLWAECEAAMSSRGERLDQAPANDVRNAYHNNYHALANADVALMLADESQPREGFAEMGFAFHQRIPVVFVGHRCLSVRYHELGGLCTVAANYDDAIQCVARMARLRQRRLG